MDTHINPTTADYDGTRIADLRNAVYLRIMTPLGSWWCDPTLGSKLHLLRRSKDLQRIQPIAEAYTREALQALIDSKRAVSVQVVSEWRHDGMLRLATTIMQAGGVAQSFEHFVRVP